MEDRLYRVFPRAVDALLTNAVKKSQTLAGRHPAWNTVRVKTLLLLTAMMLALPQAVLAAEVVPRPKLRPVIEAASPVSIPRPKPRPSPTAPEGGEVTPPQTEAEPGWSADQVAEARGACRTFLEGRDIAQEPLDPIGRPGGCGAPAPVLVNAVAGVALTPPATLTCDMAAELHDWVSGTVKPAARKSLKTEVTAINTATSYACRRRNNSSGGKLSEHGRANALDMSGFRFANEGKGVAVGGSNWGQGILAALGVSRDDSFLSAIRQGACKHFTTVLGPGSDPYHGDHFHVDVLRRKNDYRICK